MIIIASIKPLTLTPNVRYVVFAYIYSRLSQAVYESDADSDLLETSEEEEEEENTSSQEESNDAQSDSDGSSDGKRRSHTAPVR